MEGNLCNQIIFVLIDYVSNFIYISLVLIENFQLAKKGHEQSCFVHLEIGTRRKFEYWLMDFPTELNGMPIVANINVSSLGMYSMLLGMD